MKALLLTFLFASLLPAVSRPQGTVTINDITAAIGSGNVAQLMSYVDAELELSILDREDLYAKNTASGELTKFFRSFTPASFNQVHQGSSKADDAEYVIGNLSTNKGNFRVYIYVAKRGNSVVLQELRFDRQ